MEKEVVRLNDKFGRLSVLRKFNAKFIDNELFFNEVMMNIITFCIEV